MLFSLRSLSAPDLLFVVGISLVVSLLGMFMPYMNKQIFDSVIPSGTKGDLLPAAVLMAGAAVGASLFNMTRTLVLMRLRDKVTVSLQIASMTRLYTLPAGFFKDSSAGEVSKRAMSISVLSNVLSDTVLTSGLAALFSFVYFAQMVSFAPALAAPALLSVFAVLSFTILTALASQKLSRKQTALEAKLSGFVFNLLGGVQKIKLAGAEKGLCQVGKAVQGDWQIEICPACLPAPQQCCFPGSAFWRRFAAVLCGRHQTALSF